MGAVDFSVSTALIDILRRALPVEVFVETGTFEGDTVAAVAGRFSEVHSIELSNEYFRRAQERFAENAHVHIHHGDSAHLLGGIRKRVGERGAIYFLDAHWCVAHETAGEESQCPLLAEVRALHPLGKSSVLLIDDARLFLAPPPKPHEISHWPSLDELMRALRRLSATHEVMVLNDVIAYYPAAIRDEVAAHAHDVGIDWLRAAQSLQENGSLRAAIEEKEALIHSLNKAIQETRVQHLQAINEMERKERVIREVDEARKLNEAVIQGLRESIEIEKQHCTSLRRSLEEKEGVIQTLQKAFQQLEALLEERKQSESVHQAQLSLLTLESHKVLVKGLEDKEKVIQEMKKALDAYRAAFSFISYFTRPISRVIPLSALARLHPRNALPRPRLGTLYHHEPKDLVIPASYLRPVALVQAPKISIVTPSFRQGAFIERTIRSLLDQDYPNLEYFVQDGGSEDGTREILERYSGRLAGWDSRPDGGQSHAINQGFVRTSGEIMAWLNSDDILLPGALHCVADFFNRNPDVDVVYGHRLLIDENDRVIGRWILPAHEDNILSWADYVPQETLFWRRRIWDKAGGQVDESFCFAMDWDLLVRFRSAGARFIRIPRFLGGFRIHPHQKTSAAITETGFKEMDRIRERSLGRVPSSDEVRRAVTPYLLRHVGCELGWRFRSAFGGNR